MTVGDWTAVIGAFLGVLAIMGGVFKYVMSAIAELSAKRERDVAEIHSRINEVRSEYARRDDFQKAVERQERQVERILDEVAAMRTEMTTRVDKLVTSFGEAASSMAKAVAHRMHTTD